MRNILIVLLLFPLVVLAQPQPKPPEQLQTQEIMGEFTGKIDENRPMLTYDFDPYLDVYRVLGESYVLDNRLEESIERKNGRLLTMQSNYLRVPVVSPLVDLNQKKLLIPIPPMELGGAVSWQLLITDARGQVFKRKPGNGRPPRQIEWDGRGDNNSLIQVGAIYSYELTVTDAVGNPERRIVEPIKVPGIVDQQSPGWIISFDNREVFESGANILKPAGQDYLQVIVNLIKDKSANAITVSGYNSGQTKVVASFIKERVPGAQIDVKKFSDRLANVDVTLH
jgi:hypothetical protein